MGAKYHPNVFVVIGWQDNDLPIFGKIISIFVKESNLIYKIARYETLGISSHFHSYVLERKTSCTEFAKDFEYYLPLKATLKNNCL